jgi:hypothetical protein
MTSKPEDLLFLRLIFPSPSEVYKNGRATNDRMSI